MYEFQKAQANHSYLCHCIKLQKKDRQNDCEMIRVCVCTCAYARIYNTTLAWSSQALMRHTRQAGKV
jgi:hypothetical protein